MKAIICTKSGPPEVLKMMEVEKPAPKDNEVLVRVCAATVTAGDVMLRKLHPLLFLPLYLFGVRRKKIPGHEFAGEIEAVGREVKRFKQGDQVFGTTTGLSAGAYAEYVSLPEEWTSGVLAYKPANLPCESAAAVPVGAMTALQLLRKGKIQSGQTVLINGASGSVGSYAVQLAVHFGAEVTGVCSTSNVGWVKTLGAVSVIDYTKEDFTKRGEMYDLIFDAVGKSSPEQCQRVLKEGGIYTSTRSPTQEKTEYLEFIKELIEAGRFKPVIDKTYPLEKAVEAHRYVESGRKKGNVVLLVNFG